MKPRPREVTWASPPSLTEERPYQATARQPAACGRSYVWITCPFCGDQVQAFVWSLCGSGKRCTCGALHGSHGRTLGMKDTDTGGSDHHG